MIKGQDLRYIGRPFPGFNATAPFVTFVNELSVHEITILYNDIERVISRFDVKVIG